MLRWLLAGSIALTMSPARASAVADPRPPAEPTPSLAQGAQPSQPPAEQEPAPAEGRDSPADDEKKEKKAEKKEHAPLYTVTGQADFYSEHNFDDPFNNKNAFRAFDIQDDGGLHLGLLELAIQRDRRPWGFRLDLDAGPTAELVNAFEPSDEDWLANVQQAYLSLNLARGGKTYVEAGKWVTVHGAEVIEARDNWNYSRGLLFTWAIPFYHAGVRVYNYFTDTNFVQVNVTRGWNAAGADNNGCLTYGGSGGATVGKLTGFLNYMVGKEPIFTPQDGIRNLLDFTLIYTASEKWLFAFNGDYCHQDDVHFAAPAPVGDVSWKGIAGYVRRTLSPKMAITLRGEVFDDPEGAATGFAQTLTEGTATFEYRFNKHAIGKLEYRHDWSNQSVFPSETQQTFSKSQGTVIGALILSY